MKKILVIFILTLFCGSGCALFKPVTSLMENPEFQSAAITQMKKMTDNFAGQTTIDEPGLEFELYEGFRIVFKGIHVSGSIHPGNISEKEWQELIKKAIDKLKEQN